MTPPDKIKYNFDVKSDVAVKFKDALLQQLREYIKEDIRDEALPQYIIMLLKHGQTKAKLEEELKEFLADDVQDFVRWLYAHLEEHENEYPKGNTEDGKRKESSKKRSKHREASEQEATVKRVKQQKKEEKLGRKRSAGVGDKRRRDGEREDGRSRGEYWKVKGGGGEDEMEEGEVPIAGSKSRKKRGSILDRLDGTKLNPALAQRLRHQPAPRASSQEPSLEHAAAQNTPQAAQESTPQKSQPSPEHLQPIHRDTNDNQDGDQDRDTGRAHDRDHNPDNKPVPEADRDHVNDREPHRGRDHQQYRAARDQSPLPARESNSPEKHLKRAQHEEDAPSRAVDQDKGQKFGQVKLEENTQATLKASTDIKVEKQDTAQGAGDVDKKGSSKSSAIDDMNAKMQQLAEQMAEMQKMITVAQSQQSLGGVAQAPAPVPAFIQSEVDLRSVCVQHVHINATALQLATLFSKAGKVSKVSIIYGQNHAPRGVAFIEFKSAESVPGAIAMSGDLLLEQPIKVQRKETRFVPPAVPTIPNVAAVPIRPVPGARPPRPYLGRGGPRPPLYGRGYQPMRPPFGDPGRAGGRARSMAYRGRGRPLTFVRQPAPGKAAAVLEGTKSETKEEVPGSDTAAVATKAVVAELGGEGGQEGQKGSESQAKS